MSFVSGCELGFECEGVTGYLRVEVAYGFATYRASRGPLQLYSHSRFGLRQALYILLAKRGAFFSYLPKIGFSRVNYNRVPFAFELDFGRVADPSLWEADSFRTSRAEESGRFHDRHHDS